MIGANHLQQNECAANTSVALWSGPFNGKLHISSVKATLGRPKDPIPYPGRSLTTARASKIFKGNQGKSSIETTKATSPTHLRTASPKEGARAALAPNSQALPGAERAAGARRGKGSPWWA